VAVDAADGVEIRSALMRLRRATGLPVAFGGLVELGRRHVRISELSGTATAALSALAVTSGNGLGGKAVALSRPCAVTDYSVSRQISHEYDLPVAAEGLRSVLAVPVVVRRRVRGVLYGALRSAQPLGDRTLGAAVAAARDVEQALVLRDEAGELLATARPQPVREPAGSATAWEQVREAHAALRALAPRIADPALRDELLRACGLLAPEAGPGGQEVRLTPREVDVLACVAAGATNAAAAERLGVGPETVKGYLRSAMRKLGARTRGEAVVAARRAGRLP
jgi:DNA-binding CsgD family transcriptional regulator